VDFTEMKRKTNEEFLAELLLELKRTGDQGKYDLGKVRYEKATTKVIITCLKHGDKLVSPFHLLNGRRCNDCKDEKLAFKFRANPEEVFSRARILYNNKYDYSKFIYINNNSKGTIICPKHGEFMKNMDHHITRKQECIKCKREFLRARVEPILINSFLEKARAVHGDRYTYHNVEYTHAKEKIRITCPTHGDFLVTPDNHTNALSGCHLCNPRVSLGEIEMSDYIKSLGLEVENNVPILGKKHIDIFLPSLRIGIEYCGIYWHREDVRGRDYHYKKYLLARNKGIFLMQIFCDEWLFKEDIVKNILSYKVGKCAIVKPARKLEFRIIDNSRAAAFYDKTHLQGGGTPISVSFGLTLGEELLSSMSFRIDNASATATLSRYSSIGSIPGGFSKLLNNAIPMLKEKGVRCIISFSDNRISDGGVYKKNNFVKDKEVKYDYYWIRGGQRFHKMDFRRNRLRIKENFIYNENESEAENCRRMGYYKLYDAGKIKWKLEI
jgi:hypothetical protein